MSFWFNVDTGEVETDDTRSRGEQVLGPYASEAEAQSALDTAHKKTEQWDAEDREWGSGSAGATDATDADGSDG